MNKDYVAALQILRPLAAGGDSEAERVLGEMYFLGQGVKPDPKLAFTLTEQAALQRNAIAQYNLGYMYETGSGAPTALALAEKWYLAAANQQYPEAQKKLADLLRNKGQADKAYLWYGRAAELGNVEARKIYVSWTTAQVERSARLADEERRRQNQRDEEAEREAVLRDQEARDRAARDAENEPNHVALLLNQSKQNAQNTLRDLQQIDRLSRLPPPSATRSLVGQNLTTASNTRIEKHKSASDTSGAEIVLTRTESKTQSGSPAGSDVELDPVKAAEKHMSSHPGPTDANYSAELAMSKKIVREGASTSPRYSEAEARADLEKIKAVLPKNLEYQNSSHLRYVKFLGFVSESCRVMNKVQYLCNVQYDIEVANKPARAGGTISK